MINNHPEEKINKSDMLRIFAKMGEICRDEGVMLEIAIYGGSALMLEFDYRQATYDVDFIPVVGAADKVKEIANRATAAIDLSANILRDDVAIFASDLAEYKAYGEFPSGFGNLRVFTATPEYIFTMKMLAMRSAMETQDLRDVWELADACGITDAGQAESLLEKFYPSQKLPVRNRLILEDVFEAKAQKKPYSPMLGW